MVARYYLGSDDPEIQVTFEKVSNQSPEGTPDSAPQL